MRVCSGTAARRAKTAVKMEDDHRHPECGETHHRQVAL